MLSPTDNKKVKWEQLSDQDLVKFCESLSDKDLKKYADKHARIHNVCLEEYEHRHLDKSKHSLLKAAAYVGAGAYIGKKLL